MLDHVFLCEPGWETRLTAELQRGCGDTAVAKAGYGFVRLRGDIEAASPDVAMPAVAFAGQCLPHVRPCQAMSISGWAEAAFVPIVEALDTTATPWRLHAFAAPRPDGSSGGRRAQLVAARLDELLRERRRRLAKRRTLDPNAPWHDDETLVQVFLTSPDAGYLSVCDPPMRRAWRRSISRFVAGAVEPSVDRQAPSRAFAKLVEVERRLNLPIGAGETCVDLGSSPGGWAYVALERGATVTAVDRSPLRDDLMRHERLTFVRGDAFRYRPTAPVDWLLSDVIAFPERAGELLETWLGNKLCRRFCVTIKFRGDDDDAKLEPIKQFLAAGDYEFCVRRLNANKNEATAYGLLRDDAAPTICFA